jgi:hypothetical protein
MWDTVDTVCVCVCIYILFMERETKIVNWERDFLYTTAIK